MRRLVFAAAAALLFYPNAASSATELNGAAMLGALRDGGYVIYLRHDLTDTSRSDTDPIDLNDCTKQRPLSDAGRVHASKIGAAFKSLHIPVDQVLTSPVCRASETAKLAFPDLQPKSPPALVYTLALPKEELGHAADELRKMLASPPHVKSNTVLVGHTTNLKEATGLWPKFEGGALVFRPDGHGSFELVGSIDPGAFEQAAAD